MAEVREFLDDPRPDKRERLVGKLLEARTTSAISPTSGALLFVPDATTSRLRFFVPSLESWLRQRLQDNVGYDRWCAISSTAARHNGWAARLARFNQGQPSPAAFYQATELKPENLAAKTSRLFLGVKLECASVTTIRSRNGPASSSGSTPPSSRARRARERLLRADRKSRRPPRNKNPRHRQDGPGPLPRRQPARLEDRRQHAASRWPTGSRPPENPYFARAAVNRLWAQFFGIGLVDPVDESGDENPPSHPELLDELAQQFVAHQYDLKFLIRAITRAERTSSPAPAFSSSPDERRLLPRMAVKA